MNKKKTHYITGTAIIALILFPYLYLGTNSYIVIHDNLDSEFIYLHLLKITGLLFSFNGETVVTNVMNGLPRSAFHSEFSFIRVLFYLFPSYWAYVLNSVLIRIIGFTGMYLFSKDYLIKDGNKNIILLLAALFSVVPLYSLYGLSVMGQPILIWSFLNLSRQPKKILNWLIIILFPFYSHFAMIGPFIILALLVYGTYKIVVKDQSISFYYFIGLGLLIGSFIAANFITLMNFFFPGDFISFRNEWIAEKSTLIRSTKRFIVTVMSGQYHSSSFAAIPIYLLAFFSLFSVKKERKKLLHIALPFILIVLISLFDAIYPFLCYYFQNSLHILLSFQFNRFTFLIPVLWFFTLGISLKYAINRIHRFILYPLLLLQFFCITWKNEELKYNYAKIFSNRNYEENTPGFNTFYAVDLFSAISEYINKPKNDYRVVSIGIHPSIAQYNGFFTLDSYQNNYRLKYKREFRKVIENELNKDENLRKHFDNWGTRCYLFSSELNKTCNFRCTKTCNYQIESLNINTHALKEMGAEYILSSVVIANNKELQLELLKKFTERNSIWNIYLYKLL